MIRGLPRAPDERADQARERTGGVEQRERAADEQHRQDHVGAGDNAARHCQQCGHRPDGRRIDLLVGPRNHQVPARRRIGTPLVGSCGQDPRECGRDRHTGEEENERMREPELQ